MTVSEAKKAFLSKKDVLNDKLMTALNGSKLICSKLGFSMTLDNQSDIKRLQSRLFIPSAGQRSRVGEMAATDAAS